MAYEGVTDTILPSGREYASITYLTASAEPFVKHICSNSAPINFPSFSVKASCSGYFDINSGVIVDNTL